MKRRRLQTAYRGSAVAVVVLSLLIGGCGPVPKAKKSKFFTDWKNKAETSKAYSPAAQSEVQAPLAEMEKSQAASQTPSAAEPAAEAVQHTIPPKVTEPVERPLPKDPVSMKIHNEDVSLVLRTLARAVNQNIIINENVTGKVNINLEDAPWDEAFKGILRTHGLVYHWEGDIIRIAALDDINRELELLDAQQKVAKRKKQHELELLAMARQAESYEPLVTRIIPVKYADAQELKENLEIFLKTAQAQSAPLIPMAAGEGEAAPAAPVAESGGSGAILVDTHTNSLVLQVSPSEMSRLLPLIRELDKPTPQILIEAHIVEANSDLARELGVQWGGLYHGTEGGDNYWITPGQDPYVPPPNPNREIQVPPTSGYNVNFPANLSEGTGLSLGYLALDLGTSILNAQLSALEDEGKLNILSSPSVTTLDNQKAIIESGKEIPYQTVEEGEVSIEWRKAVLRLEVTPHVVDDRTLKMDIITNKDEVDFENDVLGNPTIIIKKAETKVVLFDGQTTVIGGLNRELNRAGEKGVPWLKDIPLLGHLFKSNSDASQLEELLIFITPHILKPRTTQIEPAGSETDQQTQ